MIITWWASADSLVGGLDAFRQVRALHQLTGLPLLVQDTPTCCKPFDNDEMMYLMIGG